MKRRPQPSTVLDLQCDYPDHYQAWRVLQILTLEKSYPDIVSEFLEVRPNQTRALLEKLTTWGFAEKVQHGARHCENGHWGTTKYTHYRALKVPETTTLKRSGRGGGPDGTD